MLKSANFSHFNLNFRHFPSESSPEQKPNKNQMKSDDTLSLLLSHSLSLSLSSIFSCLNRYTSPLPMIHFLTILISGSPKIDSNTECSMTKSLPINREEITKIHKILVHFYIFFNRFSVFYPPVFIVEFVIFLYSFNNFFNFSRNQKKRYIHKTPQF